MFSAYVEDLYLEFEAISIDDLLYDVITYEYIRPAWAYAIEINGNSCEVKGCNIFICEDDHELFEAELILNDKGNRLQLANSSFRNNYKRELVDG